MESAGRIDLGPSTWTRPQQVLEGCPVSSLHIHSELPAIIKVNKKFWKELICLLSLHYLKMSFALKPAFALTKP
jgi:hypothetical protein